MNRQDIWRSVSLTAGVALILAAVAWPLFGRDWALCFVLSALWGAGNLWLLARIFHSMMGPDQNLGVALYWTLVKPPFLIVGGAMIILAPFFSASAFLIGFHVILTVIVARTIRSLRDESTSFGTEGIV